MDLPDSENNGDSAGAYSEDGIPVVDLDVLVKGDSDQRAEAIRLLGRACEEWGFFMVINHGVPESLQEATMDACKELFILPTKEKSEYMDAGPMDPVRLGTGFNSTVDGAKYWRDYLKMFAHPDFHCPAKSANLRGTSTEYATRTRGLMLELTTAISESLGLDRGRIAEALKLESCFQILVGNHYPPAGPHVGAIGLPTHSDHGLLALLFQNGAVSRSSTTTRRRKPPVDEKASHKDESKIHNPARKITTSAPAPPVNADKAPKKHPPTLKRVYGVLSNPNAINLVQIPPNRKKLTHASNSSTSLPPSHAKLGKV